MVMGSAPADGEPESHEEVDDLLSLMFGYRGLITSNKLNLFLYPKLPPSLLSVVPRFIPVWE